MLIILNRLLNDLSRYNKTGTDELKEKYSRLATFYLYNISLRQHNNGSNC